MKTKELEKEFLTMGLMSVTRMKAQSLRMLEFQNKFSKCQTQCRDLLYSGKHQEAMALLASCIAMLVPPEALPLCTVTLGHARRSYSLSHRS